MGSSHPPRPSPAPLLVSIEMGYGHLRAATPLAGVLGTPLLHADREPLAGAEEQRLWARARRLYEATSRLSQVPFLGTPLRSALESVTFIPPLHPLRDLTPPTMGVRMLERYVRKGMGAGLASRLKETGEPLLTTFFAPAIAADRMGCDQVYCVVTDTDINRVWVARDAARSRIRYFAPSRRVVRRLCSYGVRRDRIELTGFPLPDELLGGPDLPVLRTNLAARLVRLDPAGSFRRECGDELRHFLGALPASQEGEPVMLTFAVGGAGAQAGLARRFLPSLRRPIEEGRLRLTLVAGVRPEVAASFREHLKEARLESQLGNGVEILLEPDLDAYFRRFNELLARTDLLWTKPSELTFFGALGVPLVFSWPVGVHERYNRRWAMEAGAGFKQRDPRHAGEWLAEWLEDGTLAGAAWNGFMRLPKFGLYRIAEVMRGAGGGSVAAAR